MQNSDYSNKISIITVVFNAEKTIQNTIESVLSQTYKNIEYIIVDGCSTDNTSKIISTYADRISKYICEKDDGIYDAMNKGIRIATGDIVGILNSDDFYVSDNILSTVANAFNSIDIDSVYGDLFYVDQDDTSKIIRRWKSREYEANLFRSGWHPAHPTLFIKRKVYLENGLFNLKFKIAADYELMLRFMEKCKISSLYIPEVFVKMRTGGASNGSLLNIIKANIECVKAWKENGLSVNFMLFATKPLSKIKQLFLKG